MTIEELIKDIEENELPWLCLEVERKLYIIIMIKMAYEIGQRDQLTKELEELRLKQ